MDKYNCWCKDRQFSVEGFRLHISSSGLQGSGLKLTPKQPESLTPTRLSPKALTPSSLKPTVPAKPRIQP